MMKSDDPREMCNAVLASTTRSLRRVIIGECEVS